MQITRKIIRTNKQHYPFFSVLLIASTSPFIPTNPSRNIYYSSNNNNNKHYTTEGSGKSQKRAVTWMLRREESGCFLLAYRIIKDLVYLVYSKNALLGCLVSLLKSITPPSFAVLLSKFRYRRVCTRGKEKRTRRKKRMLSLHKLCLFGGCFSFLFLFFLLRD